MSDNQSQEQRHHTMAAIHSSSTKPELKLRHALWNLGFRYRVNDKHLPGKPDIVLPRYHTAIFVHGCFWHGHRNCRFSSTPKSNTEFWVTKITRNQERDQEVWRQLEAKGWEVIVVWECELKKDKFKDTVRRVEKELHANGELYRQRKEERTAARLQRIAERKEQRARLALLLKELKY